MIHEPFCRSAPQRTRIRTRWAVAILACSVLVVSCASGDANGSSDADADTELGTADDGPDDAPVRLEQISGYEGAVAADADPASGALLLADKSGLVLRLAPGDDEPEVVLDLTARVAQGFEQGLLGIAVTDDGSLVYLYFTDLDDTSQIVELALVDGVVVADSERTVLSVEQPGENHNGGDLVIDDEGLLWVSLGDGLARNEFGQGTSERSQDLSLLHGSLLRIDPRASGDAPYTVPDDNPFVDDPAARPEIWAYGLRNPWRFSIDPPTGDVWIADVGQERIEELNHAAGEAGSGRGVNFGWPTYEGTELWDGPPITEHQPPAIQLSHDDAYCAVIGGPTYRGEQIPELVGWTLFSDLCDPRIQAARLGDGTDAQPEIWDLGAELLGTVSFATGLDGEIIVVSLLEGIYALEPAQPTS